MMVTEYLIELKIYVHTWLKKMVLVLVLLNVINWNIRRTKTPLKPCAPMIGRWLNSPNAAASLSLSHNVRHLCRPQLPKFFLFLPLIPSLLVSFTRSFPPTSDALSLAQSLSGFLFRPLSGAFVCNPASLFYLPQRSLHFLSWSNDLPPQFLAPRLIHLCLPNRSYF